MANIYENQHKHTSTTFGFVRKPHMKPTIAMNVPCFLDQCTETKHAAATSTVRVLFLLEQNSAVHEVSAEIAVFD